MNGQIASETATVRILLIANTLPPVDLSGAGEQVVQLAHGLEEAGHQVHVLGRGPGGARGPKVLFPLTIVLPALRAIRRLAPDVVQLHESDGGLLAAALRLRQRSYLLTALQQVSYLRELRVVRPLRGGSGEVIGRPTGSELVFKWLRAPVQLVLGWLTARCADVVFAPSATTAAELRQDYGARGVTVLPNATGAPIDRPATAPGTGAATPGTGAATPGTGAATPGIFLYVGRFRIRKGVEVLLHAMALLEGRGVDVSLDLVGDGERADRLRELARRLELRSVRFLGRQSAAEIRRRLESTPVLVVPSTYEGMPLVILEAMEAGCAVVASAVSGIPEVVVDGETGWLVPPEDPAALADAMEAAAEAEGEVERRGAQGRARLEELYRPHAVARQWIERIEAAVSR